MTDDQRDALDQVRAAFNLAPDVALVPVTPGVLTNDWQKVQAYRTEQDPETGLVSFLFTRNLSSSKQAAMTCKAGHTTRERDTSEPVLSCGCVIADATDEALSHAGISRAAADAIAKAGGPNNHD